MYAVADTFWLLQLTYFLQLMYMYLAVLGKLGRNMYIHKMSLPGRKEGITKMARVCYCCFQFIPPFQAHVSSFDLPCHSTRKQQEVAITPLVVMKTSLCDGKLLLFLVLILSISMESLLFIVQLNYCSQLFLTFTPRA